MAIRQQICETKCITTSSMKEFHIMNATHKVLGFARHYRFSYSFTFSESMLLLISYSVKASTQTEMD